MPTLQVDCYFDSEGEFQASLATNTSDRLFAAASTLESIRLRYRRRDAKVNDRKLFKLGFDKFLGNELKVNIERVDRAGHDAIIDVRTVFLDSELARLQGSDLPATYEKAVPPAAIFGQ
jgi:predicted DNA-binding WGR domain protein